MKTQRKKLMRWTILSGGVVAITAGIFSIASFGVIELIGTIALKIIGVSP